MLKRRLPPLRAWVNATRMNKSQKSTQMPYGQHAKAIMSLGLPLIGGHLAQFSIGLTDTVMMGWYSVEGLAAVTLASTFFFVLFIFGSGFAQAVMPLVASQYAENDDLQMRRTTRMGLWMSFVFAIAVMPMFYFSGGILLVLGQDPELAADAQAYLRIAGWGVIPALGVMVLKSYLAALERTQVVLWVTLIAMVVNGFANYALIFGNWGAPELGLRGSAIASLGVQILSLLVIAGYVLRALPQQQIFARLWKPDWEAFFLVGRLGVPIGFTILAEVGLFATSTLMMGWLGTIQLAAHGVALQLASLTFMIHLGLSNAATVRAGNALGRKDPDHLMRGAKLVIVMSILVALLTIVVFVSVPEPLISVFLDKDEPDRAEIMKIGALLLLMAGIFQLVDAAQVMALGLLRGLRDTKVPMSFAVFSYWVIGAPCSYLLGFVFQFEGAGVWGGLVVGLAVAAILMTERFFRLGPKLALKGA
ncbi:mate efflux family protein [Rhodobacteraceae bacterium HTCC2083]|jgi:MATE family multidrug resistance protein|uniref:MATE family efflux transporter n=1 Tax=Planktotalea sp. TaxID=2029877 RepID=UPI0001838B05|nr:mate efflux family protein [Rhodobacteraceae bacterium HTCC2083]